MSLIRKGYAQQLTDGRYSLGERAHAFGVNALKRTDMLELSQRYIQDIQQRLNCSIHVSKWFADGAVVFQSLESNHVFNIITRDRFTHAAAEICDRALACLLSA